MSELAPRWCPSCRREVPAQQSRRGPRNAKSVVFICMFCGTKTVAPEGAK